MINTALDSKVPIDYNYNFKTLDDIVDHYTNTSWIDHDIWAIHIYLLTQHAEVILKILRSKTNKPSVHDLTVIKYASDNLIYSKDYGEILKVYKNRKD